METPEQLPSSTPEVTHTPVEPRMLDIFWGALRSKAIGVTGRPRGTEYVPEVLDLLADSADFMALGESERTALAAATMRGAYTYNRNEPTSPFRTPEARRALVAEASGEFALLTQAGWTSSAAQRLVLHGPAESFTALRDRYAVEHGALWTKGRLAKIIGGNPQNAEETIRLITDAFTYTREQGELVASNAVLHEAIEMPKLRAGNLLIEPKQSSELPPLSIDEPEGALDLLFATNKTGSNTRKNPASLTAYLTQTIEVGREMSPVLQTLEPEDYTEFLKLLAWYADNSGYEAVNSRAWTQTVAEHFATNVAAILDMGATKKMAIELARHHHSAYYQAVVTKAEEYGITKDHLFANFIRRAPSDAMERLELIRPLYDTFAKALPDVASGTRLLLSMRALTAGSEKVLTDFEASVRNAQSLFKNVSLSVIHTTCAAAPNTYEDRLRAYVVTWNLDRVRESD